jgi:hypothetical protein
MASDRAPEWTVFALSSDKLYVRALYKQFNQAVHIYVGVDDGLLVVNSSGNFARPKDYCTYATEWDLLTAEKDPRVILSFSESSS